MSTQVTQPSRRSRPRPQPWLVGALVVGLVLRVIWALVATPSALEPRSDPYEYLRYADALAHLSEYRINGQITAFYPIGWPLVMSPLVYVANHVGWLSQVGAAGVATVAFSVFAIYATYRLGALWFDRRVALLASWLVALSPALIGIVATPLTESPFIAVLLAVCLLLSKPLVAHPFRAPSAKALVGFGVLAAFLVLIRSQGLVVLPLAGLLVGLRVRAWGPVLRLAGWMLLGVSLVFVPMAVRNGVQIGFWSPMSTGNLASSTCLAHHERSTGWDATYSDEELLAACHWGAPDAGNDREAEWAREAPREALRFALAHPGQEWRLGVQKAWLIFGQDREGGALEYTQYLGSAPAGTVDALYRAMAVWRLAALALTALALVASRRARQATVLWAVPLLLVVSSYAGFAAARVFVPVIPFLVIFSAFAIRQLAVRIAGAPRVPGDRGSDRRPSATLFPMAVDSPGASGTSGGRAGQAGPTLVDSQGTSGRARTAGRPLHPAVAALAMGAWVMALAFDAVSWVSSTEWVYARGAWLLTALGVVVGLVAALLGLIDLLAIDRSAPAFRIGIRHLAAMDTAIVLFALSFAVRNQSDFEWHATAPPLALALSLVGLTALALGTWYGTGLTYRHGVHVAAVEDDLTGPTS